VVVRRLVLVLTLGLLVAWWASALVARAAPGDRLAVLVVGDLDDADATVLEGQLRTALKALRESGTLSGVGGLSDSFLRYDLQRADHKAPLQRLGIGPGSRCPRLLVVELDGRGKPSGVRWGLLVTDVGQAVAALQQTLGVAATSPAPSRGSNERVNAKDGSVLVCVPAGSFRMGSKDGGSSGKPVHAVTLSEYWIGKYEVTNAQFKRFMSETGYDAGNDWREKASEWGARAPVVSVSWNDAQAYCRWAGLRLPTEAEWEKAARGTDGRKYPWGNEGPENRAWYDNNSGGRAHDVGSALLGVSPYGCLDMAGNVDEWCQDWYDRYPGNTEMNNNYGTKYRILRGGSWLNSDGELRCAIRGRLDPDGRFSNVGFRCSL